MIFIVPIAAVAGAALLAAVFCRLKRKSGGTEEPTPGSSNYSRTSPVKRESVGVRMLRGSHVDPEDPRLTAPSDPQRSFANVFDDTQGAQPMTTNPMRH